MTSRTGSPGIPGAAAGFTALGRRFLASAAVALALIVGAASPASAKYASLVMDAETGEVVHAINADTRNYPASLTKMMTVYLVFEALKTELWTMNTPLRVSARASRQPSSKLGLNRGQRITVEDAILALVTKSANDVATVVAENMSGSERSFALRMTAKARMLGMSRTTFRNASGLPHRGQLSTARDMATLARALIRDFPVYYRYFSTEKFAYHGITHENHNKLLGSYEGVDGIKTGYIRASGFNLVASAQRGSHRVIGVIFGGNSPNSRNTLMTRLLNLGFKAVGAGAETTVADNDDKPQPTRVASADRDDEGALPKHRLWGIQVGAFAREAQAYEAARKAIELATSTLKDGAIKVVPLRKRNGRVLHRARIYGVTKQQAYGACRIIKRRDGQCMEMRLPDGYRVAANER